MLPEDIERIPLLIPSGAPAGHRLVGAAEAERLFAAGTLQDAACVAWEEMRVRILARGCREAWSRLFHEARAACERLIRASDRAARLRARLGLSEDALVASLPFIGAVGETLAHDGMGRGFFSEQIGIHQCGCWVCGLDSGRFVICDEV